MASYLLVGSFPNYFNVSLLNEMKRHNMFSFYGCLLTSESNQVNRGEHDFDELVSLINTPRVSCPKFFRRILIVFFILQKYLYLMLRLRKYDVIHVQSMSIYHLLFIPLLRLKSKRLCVTFWGSDFNLASKLDKQLFKVALKLVDGVSSTSMKMRNDLVEQLELDCGKVFITRFGLPTAEFLDDISLEDIELTKQRYGFQGKTVVMCTTSSDKIRQVFDVIDAVLLLPLSHLEKAVFVFHLSYGDSEYKKQILEKLNSVSCFEYVVIDEFLDAKDMAALRKATNIYINVALADQLSGAMMEAIYCNNILIVGDWLKYIELDKRGVSLHRVASVAPEVLSVIISDCIVGAVNGHFPDNSQKIRDLLFWNDSIQSWSIFLKTVAAG